MLFSADEKVLCFHVGLLYEAKVRKGECKCVDPQTNASLTDYEIITILFPFTATKVLKAEKWLGNDNLNNDVGPHYLVHYRGWRARCE